MRSYTEISANRGRPSNTTDQKLLPVRFSDTHAAVALARHGFEDHRRWAKLPFVPSPSAPAGIIAPDSRISWTTTVPFATKKSASGIASVMAAPPRRDEVDKHTVATNKELSARQERKKPDHSSMCVDEAGCRNVNARRIAVAAWRIGTLLQEKERRCHREA